MDNWSTTIWPIITSLGTASGWLPAIYLFRRQKRAQVAADEATTADKMVDLVKKSFELSFENLKADFKAREKLILDSNESLKRSNDKLCRRISALEKAIKSIETCPYSGDCPVIHQLQDAAPDG